MRFGGPLTPATFKARLNRFLGEVEIEGRRALCFIPNPGRMEELLRIDARIHLLERIKGVRKTRYDLVLVDTDGTLVSIDSRTPNTVVAEAIETGRLPEFRGLRIEKRELTFGDSRLDLRLAGCSSSLMLEVKSCTLVEDGVGFFPDAPTKRGRRHTSTPSSERWRRGGPRCCSSSRGGTPTPSGPTRRPTPSSRMPSGKPPDAASRSTPITRG